MAGPIAVAVEAVEQAVEPRFGGQMALSTGRAIAISLPADMTDAEYLEAVVILIAQVRASARQSQAGGARGRIIVPSGTRIV
jgi:hypothetical protein